MPPFSKGVTVVNPENANPAVNSSSNDLQPEWNNTSGDTNCTEEPTYNERRNAANSGSFLNIMADQDTTKAY
jgi:hypothetical protein